MLVNVGSAAVPVLVEQLQIVKGAVRGVVAMSLIRIGEASVDCLKKVAKDLHTYLKQRVINEKFGLLLYSPVPSPIDRIKDRYRWRMLIKCKYDDRINNLLIDAYDIYLNMKTKTARVNIELNPNNML